MFQLVYTSNLNETNCNCLQINPVHWHLYQVFLSFQLNILYCTYIHNECVQRLLKASIYQYNFISQYMAPNWKHMEILVLV